MIFVSFFLLGIKQDFEINGNRYYIDSDSVRFMVNVNDNS